MQSPLAILCRQHGYTCTYFCTAAVLTRQACRLASWTNSWAHHEHGFLHVSHACVQCRPRQSLWTQCRPPPILHAVLTSQSCSLAA